MSVPDLEPLRESLDERVTELEEEQERQEKRHQGDGSTPAVWDKVEPKIRRTVVKNCRSDLEEVDEADDLLRVLAEWRRSENREWEFNRNKSRTENERNNIKSAEIRMWKDSLIELIPDSQLKTCIHCESTKLPRSNRRLSREYEWECPDCQL